MFLKLSEPCAACSLYKHDQRLWEKRIKAPSLDMNNTEQISLEVGALPHSTLIFQNDPTDFVIPTHSVPRITISLAKRYWNSGSGGGGRHHKHFLSLRTNRVQYELQFCLDSFYAWASTHIIRPSRLVVPVFGSPIVPPPSRRQTRPSHN